MSKFIKKKIDDIISDKYLALFIAVERSFCLDLDTFVILLGIILPFSLTYLERSLMSL